MRDKNTKEVSVYMPEILYYIVKSVADNRDTSVSSMINEILIENIKGKTVLSITDKKIIEQMNKEIEINKLKYLRSKSAEKLNFLSNIKKQLHRFVQTGQHLSPELKNNLELSLNIARINEWNDEVRQIELMIKRCEEKRIVDTRKNEIEYEKKFIGKGANLK